MTVTDDIKAHYQPRRALPNRVEVPAWFIAFLTTLALSPTLLIVAYTLLI